MAAQIADKTTNYFDADGTPDLQTAVFYTELQYGIKPNTNEEIKAEDFCKKVKDNFTGNQILHRSRFSKNKSTWNVYI